MTRITATLKNSPPIPSQPSQQRAWLPWLHVALTVLLAIVAFGFVGLALVGRFHLGSKATPETVKDESLENVEKKRLGRYQIEKADDARDVLIRTGKSGFFGTPLADAFVFKYSGGLIECKLEVDTPGEEPKSDIVPDNWKQCLQHEDVLTRDPNASLERNGYIVLTAINSPVSLTEALAPHHLHFGGVVAFGSYGPMHLLTPLHLPVSKMRNYKLSVSALPPPGVDGTGFNTVLDVWHRIRSDIIAQDPAFEEAHVSGVKDATPGKEVLLLDRQRGHSRIRLKARFLGDGEVREVLQPEKK